MWHKIVNPETGRKVDINGSIGKKIIKNYVKQLGGNAFTVSGPSAESMVGNINLYAIGGPTEERAKRSALARSIFPTLNGHYYLTTGGITSSNFMETSPGEVAFFPIPASQAPQFVVAPQNSPAVEANIITTSPSDTVLVIGHTSFDPDIAVSMLSEIHPSCSVFLQGPGFNIGLASGNGTSNVRTFGESLTTFKTRVPNTVSFHANDCHDYNFAEWAELLNLYALEPAILELHQYGVAAFFTSRYDGAFHRQFSLVNLDTAGKKQFELSVAEAIANHSEISENIKKIARTINSTLSQKSDDYFNYETGKEGNWIEVYQLWYPLNASNFPALMPILSKIIINTIISTLPDATIKEYDGLVCHNMLRANVVINGNASPLPNATKEQHYKFLKIVLNPSAIIDAETRDYLFLLARGALKNILSRGNLVIVHDLGLDPMVDDFIAIKIIDYLKNVLDAVSPSR